MLISRLIRRSNNCVKVIKTEQEWKIISKIILRITVMYCWACWLKQYRFCPVFENCQFGIQTRTSTVLAEGSYGFSQFLQANCCIVAQSIQRLLIFRSFLPILYSLLSCRQRCIFGVTLRVFRYTQTFFSITDTKLIIIIIF